MLTMKLVWDLFMASGTTEAVGALMIAAGASSSATDISVDEVFPAGQKNR